MLDVPRFPVVFPGPRAARNPESISSDDRIDGFRVPAVGRPRKDQLIRLALFVTVLSAPAPALAQTPCRLAGTAVTCEDGRVGIFTGDAILWPDGTRSTSSPNPSPSVIIGRPESVRVGPGVFVGQGRGSVPLDDPNAAMRRSCAVIENVRYC